MRSMVRSATFNNISVISWQSGLFALIYISGLCTYRNMYMSRKAEKSKHYVILYILKQFIILLVPYFRKPDKLQRTLLKPFMQPYAQFPSRDSHILPTHASHRDSQLTPYVPVVHSEKNNALLYTNIYTDYTKTYTWCLVGLCC